MVIEATSDYWKPFYYLLEDAGFELVLVNARHVKTLPGRKTDVADATWLAHSALMVWSALHLYRLSRSGSCGTSPALERRSPVNDPGRSRS